MIIPGLFRLITYLVVPRYYSNRPAPKQETSLPVSVPPAAPEPPKLPEWNYPELVAEYPKLLEAYKHDPVHFERVLGIAMRCLYADLGRDTFLAEQDRSGPDNDGPDPVEPEPVVSVEPVVQAIHPGWYFYGDGILYDGFKTWEELNAALSKLAARGVSEFSEIEKMD